MTPSDKTVELVARAIAPFISRDTNMEWVKTVDIEACRPMAKAAIAAMNMGDASVPVSRPNEGTCLASPATAPASRVNERLLEALKRSSIKLRAYFGVCKDDKELPTVIEIARAAIKAAEEG